MDFLKLTKNKVIISMIPLIIFMPILIAEVFPEAVELALSNPAFETLSVILILVSYETSIILSVPFFDLFRNLNLIGSVGFFDIGTHYIKFWGIIVTAIFYFIIIYLIISLINFIKNKNAKTK